MKYTINIQRAKEVLSKHADHFYNGSIRNCDHNFMHLASSLREGDAFSIRELLRTHDVRADTLVELGLLNHAYYPPSDSEVYIDLENNYWTSAGNMLRPLEDYSLEDY